MRAQPSVFGSWICVAYGSGGFNSHLAYSREPETSASIRRCDLNEFIDNLDEMLLTDLAREIKEASALNAISTHAALGLLRSDPIQSGEECTRLLFGLHNVDPVY
jgi:hypothetical protein